LRKILVTGGCGFIGSNFVLHLLRTRKDVQVVNLDKLTYAGNLTNLSEIEGDPRHRFVRGDICDEALVGRLLADGVDSVVNFAAETHVDRSIQDSAPFILTNVGGTHALLTAARKNKVRKFIQVGTDEVYGSLGPSGLFTEDSPLQPNNPYSASKAGADLLVRAFQRTYGMDATITRCTNNYGPFQFPEKAIPVFIGNALVDRPIPVYGDGLHVRDWLFVEDHCRAIEAVMERGRAGEVYNVGGANELPNIELARLILRELKKPESLIQFVKDRPGHDRRYALDSSKLSRELGWKPLVSLAEGIPRTVRWYCEHQDWLRRVQTGEYQEYYRKHYHERHGLQE
jgi:dTDP-glucose 4,6-dehydratase